MQGSDPSSCRFTQPDRLAHVSEGESREGIEAGAWRHTVAAIAAVALLLSGCAMSPGMSYGTMGRAAGDPRTGGEAGTALAATQTKAAQGADAPPPHALVEINSELIAQELSNRSTEVSQNVAELFAEPAPYTLGYGDVLQIMVWDHPEMNQPNTSTGGGADSGTSSVVSGYTVDSTGIIQLPYVGPVKVIGLTELEARDLVARKLSRYLREPQVTLRIAAYRGKRIYLDGEVRNPGLQVLNDMPMTLPEAINRAGGFTTTADRSEVSITRGKKTVVVNLPDMIKKGVNPDSILLRNGDLVRVFSQNDSKAYVLGEVGHPGNVLFNNGRLSLSDAIGSAGGINQASGDASQVYVVRRQDGADPTVFHLDATSPTAMAIADGFNLKPSDVVFVDASGLVRWSRVINLILPSTQAAATGRMIGY
ncbi:polysaccharide biosynthesis/export family protein [Paraburkholderia piptadeniae]|uniref:polysaccharide biosynthesis/export family protein n=1 Tax=Paraburkholderia piptadeniae TaxID=1701573 RepID=UPI001F42BBBB|nr:polysaccharide biosynthesis/export family protein [Paraburkholderia piptadeniae]